jgi:hypothetical protein
MIIISFCCFSYQNSHLIFLLPFLPVDEALNNILIGTISYKVLCSLLKHKAFTPGNNSPIHVNNVRVAPLLNWGTIECVYPNFPKIEEISLQEHEK